MSQDYKLLIEQAFRQKCVKELTIKVFELNSVDVQSSTYISRAIEMALVLKNCVTEFTSEWVLEQAENLAQKKAVLVKKNHAYIV